MKRYVYVTGPITMRYEVEGKNLEEIKTRAVDRFYESISNIEDDGENWENASVMHIQIGEKEIKIKNATVAELSDYCATYTEKYGDCTNCPLDIKNLKNECVVGLLEQRSHNIITVPDYKIEKERSKMNKEFTLEEINKILLTNCENIHEKDLNSDEISRLFETLGIQVQEEIHQKPIGKMTIDELYEWCDRRQETLMDSCGECPFYKHEHEDCILDEIFDMRNRGLLVNTTFKFTVEKEDSE